MWEVVENKADEVRIAETKTERAKERKETKREEERV